MTLPPSLFAERRSVEQVELGDDLAPRFDDDQDALILFVRIQAPGSCHVGFRSCFYREVDLDAADPSRPARLLRTETVPAFDADAVYPGLPSPTIL